MEKLRYFFDDNLILAALDLVDRDSGMFFDYWNLQSTAIDG